MSYVGLRSPPCTGSMLKPVELEIELFCRGMRIDNSTGEGRSISRTRAGLGSGLELILRGGRKDIWVNVPVVEPFAQHSPFLLRRRSDATGDRFVIVDGRDAAEYPVEVPPEPKWYSRHTSSDVLMSRIGVLQGNYVGIYVSTRCAYWTANAAMACRFCTTGANVGTAEESRKSVEDVVEVARAARGVRLHLHALQYRLPLRRRRPPRAVPRPAAVRALRARRSALRGRLHRRAGRTGAPRVVPRV